MKPLLSVREAQDIVLSTIQALSPQKVTTQLAYGRVLAENIVASFDLPHFANSSMDGFAIYQSDAIHASPEKPAILNVVADIPAGTLPGIPLSKGQAARIMTGAPIPPGADAVVPIEDTDQSNQLNSTALPDVVKIFKSAQKGQFIRQVGDDIHQGEIILEAGKRLNPQDVGMLVTLGQSQVLVQSRPRVAIFSSGDELQLLDHCPPAPGKIFDANQYVLTGLLQNEGCEVIQLGIAQDSPESVSNKLAEAVACSPDLIISTAGVSVGVYDYTRQEIEARGSLSFWRVNMRPGKPLVFGNYQGIPYIGLPGNPVSAYVGCVVYVIPAVRKFQTLPPFEHQSISVITSEAIQSDGRESYLRCNVYNKNGNYYAKLTGHQGSGNLFSLVQANALVIIPAEVKQVPAGATLTAWLLKPNGDV
jgi:molybdopterin molybdotransferase